MFDKVREKLARASSLLTPSRIRGSKSWRKEHTVACPDKGKAPYRYASLCCEGQRLPRLMIPENVKARDDIDRAMATNSDCDPEDSPTWGKQSAFSASISWDGANGIKEVEDLVNGTTWSATGARLGKSAHSCVWTEAMVENFDATYVVYEARRRVRKWYNDKYERLQNEVDRELAEHLERHPDRPASRALKAKQRELEVLRAALDERLKEEKAEATRRVIPLILPALSESTRSSITRDKRRGTF